MALDDASATPRAPYTREQKGEMIAGIKGLIRSLLAKSRIPREEREDAEQTCILAILSTIDNHDPARSKFSTWATSICQRVLADVYSRSRIHATTMRELLGGEFVAARPESSPEDDAEPDLFGDLHAAIRDGATEGLLDLLTPGMREIVRKIVVDRLTVDQVALQLGQTRHNLICNLQKAIGQLTGHDRFSRKSPTVVPATPDLAAPVRVNGISRTVEEWSELHGVPATTIRSRLIAGWEPERAVSHKAGQRFGKRIKLADSEWEIVEPLLRQAGLAPPRGTYAGSSPRRFLDLLLLLAIGTRGWARFPKSGYGTRPTAWSKFFRWLDAGVFDRLIPLLRQNPGLERVARGLEKTVNATVSQRRRLSRPRKRRAIEPSETLSTEVTTQEAAPVTAA